MAKKFHQKALPIFADEVMVSFTVKSGREGPEKDVTVKMGFVDTIQNAVVAEIALTPITADALHQILHKTLEKIEEVREGKIEKPEQQEQTTTYIG